MSSNKLKELLEKYYNGTSTMEEEVEIRNIFASENIPEAYKEDAEIFAMYQAMQNDSTDIEISVPENIPVVKSIQVSWWSGIAASVAFLITGIAIGVVFSGRISDDTDISSLRDDIKEMKELVVLNQLKNESVSERILATYSCMELDSAGDEILNALINTLHNDDNANVKNAAADALLKFGNHEKVRKAFITVLASEEDPILQIKLIEMLVELQEKRALPTLQDLMNNENKMIIVKDKAAEGITKLL